MFLERITNELQEKFDNLNFGTSFFLYPINTRIICNNSIDNKTPQSFLQNQYNKQKLLASLYFNFNNQQYKICCNLGIYDFYRVKSKNNINNQILFDYITSLHFCFIKHIDVIRLIKNSLLYNCCNLNLGIGLYTSLFYVNPIDSFQRNFSFLIGPCINLDLRVYQIFIEACIFGNVNYFIDKVNCLCSETNNEFIKTIQHKIYYNNVIKETNGAFSFCLSFGVIYSLKELINNSDIPDYNN